MMDHRCWAVLAIIGCLAACDDDVAPPRAKTATAAPTTPAQDWLMADAETSPGVWLAEHDAARAAGGAPLKASDYAVYGMLLSHAGQYYHETPRMIANRIAQMHLEIHDLSPDLTMRQMLLDFAWAAGNDRPQTLGEVGQHYLVLRRQGLDHPTAMADLRRAYGAAPAAQ